jgi:enoyl-CoA hydratase/carnithine racemase
VYNLRIELGELETLRFERDGDVGLLILHRPERRNVWTVRMAAELSQAMTTIDASGEIRAMVVTGADDVFSVGADLDSASLLAPGDEDIELPDEPMLPSRMRIPVIAAINGHAGGSRHHLLAALRSAHPGRLGEGGVPVRQSVASSPSWAPWLLPRVVGIGVATDLLLSGRTLLADEALRLGLVHRVLPSEAVLPAAIETAHEIVRTTAPLAVSAAKRLVWEGLEEAWGPAWARERAEFERCALHPDSTEGMRSFLEHRDPRWSGRLPTLDEASASES